MEYLFTPVAAAQTVCLVHMIKKQQHYSAFRGIIVCLKDIVTILYWIYKYLESAILDVADIHAQMFGNDREYLSIRIGMQP